MRPLPALIVSMAFAASACAPNGQPTTTRTPGSGRPASATTVAEITDRASEITTGITTGGGAARFARALTPFADCGTFLDHVKAEARRRVGPYGLDAGQWAHWEQEATAEMGAEDTAASAAEPASAGDGDNSGGGGGEGRYTTTNVQELGVDEPDIVKTDGTRIVAVTENRLSHIDVTGEPTLTDTIVIPEGWGHELFIRGDRALVFTNGGEWGHPMPAEETVADDPASDIASEPSGPATLIVDVDLSDPSDLRIVATMRIEGQYLSARAIDDRVRLAVTSPPTRLPWLHPQDQNGEARAHDANRATVDDSTLEDWLPGYRLEANGSITSGALLSCERAHRPPEFSGFDMVSIVELDLGAGLAGAADRIEAVGVLAGGQTVYSSTDRMYVATTRWADVDPIGDPARLAQWDEEYQTDLHAFAIAVGEPTRYVASGTIDGSLLDQFSLDEHEGYLRVITTQGSPWGRSEQSESHLVVLQEQDDRLVAVGAVGGLGRGEQLYSARLMGDVGFAVTFRQVDPFYVLDLSDPTNPRITGELKIPGFSTYLHPVGDDRVLGVGQAATEDGRTTGLKLSLFDVSDPADPREIAVWTAPGSTSPVESDHRAFQMIGTTAIVPVHSWIGDFNGAVLVDLTDGIDEVGRVSHVPIDGEPASDCRQITSADLTPEESELFWMTHDGYGHVQLCGSQAAGGWGDWYCELIPVDEVGAWFGSTAADDLAAIGARSDDRIETCFPNDGYADAIQRSLVIDDTLWTLTPSAAQANALAGLAVRARVSLR